MSNNRYERNPALHRDMPENLFEDQGLLPVTFYTTYNDFPCLLPYEVDGANLIIDISIVNAIWEEGMLDDLNLAIDRKFGNHFLSRKDLNLNIIGL